MEQSAKYSAARGFELKDLDYFVAVAQASGIRRAATQLDAQLSSVSRRIRDLEDMLGVSLFDRHQGGVRLTEAGARFRSDLRPMFTQLDSALRKVRAAGRVGEGSLRIGIVASLASGFLNRLLSQWLAEHPRIALDFAEGSPRDHFAALLDGRLDLAFVTGSPTLDGCDVETLCTEPIYVAACSNHSLASGATTTWPMLRDEHFIVTEDAPGLEIHDYIVRHLSDIGVSPMVERYAVGRESLMVLIGLGLGVSFVSGAEVGVRYSNVAYVPLEHAPLLFSAVWLPGHDNPALRRMLSAARVLARSPTNNGSRHES